MAAENARQRDLGKLLSRGSMQEMVDYAMRHGLLVEERIDLRGKKIRFDHKGLDLSRFLLDSADLSGSRLRDCAAEGASFRQCTLRDCRVEATRACSFQGASFAEAKIERSYFGPRVLDLADSAFTGARLAGVKFMLGKLPRSDFERAVLKDVEFRAADLTDANFRGAALERVCLESASLAGADFTDAVFREMEHWGEPDFSGAIISDELRYGFVRLEDPVSLLETVIARGAFTDNELVSLRRFRDEVANFVGSAPEAMLIATEYEDVISPELFRRVAKQMKAVVN